MKSNILSEINRNRELMGLSLLLEATFPFSLYDELSDLFAIGRRNLTDWANSTSAMNNQLARETLDTFDNLAAKFSITRDELLQRIQQQTLSISEFDEVVAALMKQNDILFNKMYSKFLERNPELKSLEDLIESISTDDEIAKKFTKDAIDDFKTKLIDKVTNDPNLSPEVRDAIIQRVSKKLDDLKVNAPDNLPQGWNKSWDDIDTLTPEDLKQIESLAGTGFVNKFRQFTQGFKDFFTKEAQQIDEVTSLIKSYESAYITEKTAILQRISSLLEQLTKTRTKNFADYNQFLQDNLADRTLRTKFNSEGILKSARVLADGSEWAEWLKLNKTITERRAALRQTWIDMIKPSWSKAWRETFTTKEGSSVLPFTFLKKWSNIITSGKYKEYRWSLVYGGTLSFKQIGYLFKKFGWRVAVTELSKEYGVRTMNYILLMAAVDIATDYLAYGLNSLGIYFGKDLSQFKPIQNQLEDYYKHSSAEDEISEIEFDEQGNPIPRTNLEKIIDSLEDVGTYLVNIGLENAELKNLIGGLGDDLLLYAGALNDPQDEEAMRREGQRLMEESQRVIETSEGAVRETTDSLGVNIPAGDTIVNAIEGMPTESDGDETSDNTAGQETEEVSMNEIVQSIQSQKGKSWVDKYITPEGGDVVDNGDGTYTIYYSDVNDASLKGKYTTIKQDESSQWVYTKGVNAGKKF